MLKTLHIKNIALITDVTVELLDGLNILSGETGAGKSIVIDSLNFVLGERADKGLIRFGEDKAQVEAVFENYLTPNVGAFLDSQGIEAEEVLILRRKMTVSGKNECRINGNLVTLSVLKGLTELLCDIHGQHEHQSLLKTDNHLLLLDAYGGDKIASQKAKVAKIYSELKAYEKQLSAFGADDDRERRLDILSYQIEEIEKANLSDPEEEDNLLAERKKFRNAEKITSGLEESRQILDGYEQRSVIADLNTAKQLLAQISDYDDEIKEIVGRIESAKIELRDVSDTLEQLLDSNAFDERRLEWIENRLSVIRQVKKKYGATISDVTEFYDKIKAEHDMLANSAELVEELKENIAMASSKLEAECEKLSELRKSFAKKFEKDIFGELKDLGMGSSTFKVDFKPTAPASSGSDKVEFLISPNVGEPLKELAKIISGGEMSRFMLALKNITARLDDIGTMVFDEIDTGISGNIAQVVAEKLYNIAYDRQVIAVTHLPQLASMADTHYLIEKTVSGGKTSTNLKLLSGDDEIREIARLVGGKEYSDYAALHATEMKKHALAYKENRKKQA